MFKEISTEYILGSVLYFRPNGISITELNNLEQEIYNHNTDLIMDISRNSIIAVLESYEDYFKLQDDLIVLNNYYLQNIERIRNRFVDVLDEAFMDAIQIALPLI